MIFAIIYFVLFRPNLTVTKVTETHINTAYICYMKFILKNKIFIIGVLAGAVIGYLYYSFIGCNSGTCAITSKPLNSTIYGALLGGLITMKNNKKGIS